MYAHNAKKFDNYLLLNTSFESGRHDTYKFKTVIKSGSGLIKVVLIVASKEQKSVRLNFMCTLAHIPGSLEQLAKDYGSPILKGSLDHKAVNQSNYMDLKPEWLPYLIKDVQALGFVWTKYYKQMQELTGLAVHKSLSSPSLAWSYLLHITPDLPTTFKFFMDVNVRKFVRRSIHGGRCVAYG